MGKAIAREIYRRGHEMVVVRGIKISSDTTLQPGTLISDKGVIQIEVKQKAKKEVDGEMVEVTETVVKPLQFKQLMIRAWYGRRRIGFKGSKWTEAMLASLKTDRQNMRPEVVGDGSTPEEHAEGDIIKGEKTWAIYGHEGEYKTKKAAEAAWAAYIAEQEEQAKKLASEESKSNDLPPEPQPEKVASDESQPEKDAEDEAWD